jgi:RNA polymerase sigma-70 factor (ECF subfamily)
MAVRRRQSVGDKVVRRLAWSKDAFTSPADEPLLQLEAVESVRIALNQLPVEQQQVVRMRIYEEKTFAVIAQELNIPLGTALARMRSALTKLRKKLEDRDTAP